MGCKGSANSFAKYFLLIGLSLLSTGNIIMDIASQAQVISPELRRLSVASNQFGMDTLKALDRIEPPDKVLVFCPPCLSSSLTMIMMGSSKHQVVSALRHALYIWSMSPQEINRGFKDIFEHIGFNQNSPLPHKLPSSATPSSAINEIAEFRRHITPANFSLVQSGRRATINDETRLHPVESAYRSALSWSPINLGDHEIVSLPALIRLKSLAERASELQRPWWHNIARSSRDKARPDQPFAEVVTGNLTLKEHRLNQKYPIESSQMSALSNIYIQRGLNMNYNYNLLLRQYYKTVIHPVDFMRNAEETRLHINSIVASSTENKIKDLVKKGSFNLKPAPRIMMVSTLHFRGTLDIEMKAPTKHKPSVVPSRRRRRRSHADKMVANVTLKKPTELSYIETESTPLKYGHFSSLGCSVIEVPFDNRLVTLVIVMPDDRNSTDLLLTKLSAQILNDLINSLVVKRLSLGIPVIKFDRGPTNMSGLLQELGLSNIFHGDRPYSTETGLNRWLRPTDIVHETSIDIGTMNPDWAQPEDRLKLGAHDSRNLDANYIKLDKPFFYFVIDSINSLILTMGRIRQ